MSNLWFNLRIGIYHIQAGDRQWWRFSIHPNEWHKGRKDSPFIELYDLRMPASWIGGRPASPIK